MPPGSNETINGTERIGWDQLAADAVELAAIRYVIYVDGSTRTELTGVSSAASATTSGFACAARLPALSLGAHTLQLASFVNNGSVLESARSAVLRVTVVVAATAMATPAPAIRAATIRTSDGLGARVEPVANGLERRPISPSRPTAASSSPSNAAASASCATATSSPNRRSHWTASWVPTAS